MTRERRKRSAANDVAVTEGLGQVTRGEPMTVTREWVAAMQREHQRDLEGVLRAEERLAAITRGGARRSYFEELGPTYIQQLLRWARGYHEDGLAMLAAAKPVPEPEIDTPAVERLREEFREVVNDAEDLGREDAVDWLDTATYADVAGVCRGRVLPDEVQARFTTATETGLIGASDEESRGFARGWFEVVGAALADLQSNDGTR